MICCTEITSITEGNVECFKLLDYLAFRSKVPSHNFAPLDGHVQFVKHSADGQTDVCTRHMILI